MARAYWQSQNKKDPNVPVSASEQIKDTKVKSPDSLNKLSEFGNFWATGDGRIKRLYLDPEKIGLKVERKGNGKIKSATLNGEEISKSKALSILNSKPYIDLKTGKTNCYSKFIESGETGQLIANLIKENMN